MKKSILVLLSAIIVFFFVGCFASPGEDSSVPIPTSQSILDSLTGDFIEGSLISATFHTITIEALDGNTYIFPSDGVPVDSNYGSLVPGASMLVYYHGTLDPTLADTQPVETERFIVTSGKGIGEFGGHIGNYGGDNDSASDSQSVSDTSEA